MEDYLYKLLKIYNNLPLPIKIGIGKLYNLIPYRLRYGKFYDEYKQRIKSHTGMSSLLNKTLKYVKDYIPYYNNTEFNYIYTFPIITKDILRDKKNDFINNDFQMYMLEANTGGTSGTPLTFYLHKGISRAKEKAHFDWYWGQFGYKQDDKILMLRGAPLKNNALYEYLAIDNKLSVSCYGLNKSNIGFVLEQIEKFKPKFIYGYPSAVKIFTKLVDGSHVNSLKNIKAIFLGSEYLSYFDRSFFENYYQTRVVNWYGHSERLIHAGNCPYNDEYHIYPFYGYAELIDENNNIIEEANKIGKIIATGFDNKVMPLIRYDTGDLAEYSETTNCKCGFKGRSFKKIYGREQDYIYLNDDTTISVTAFIFGQHFNEFSKILELQLVQNYLDVLDVNIVPNGIFDKKDIDSLKKQMSDSIQGKLKININLVGNIEKTKMGKHRILIQNIKKDN